MTTVTLQEKFAALDAAMRAALIEREEDIEIFQLALLAKTHAFYLGEPGIAKSLLVETGVKLISGLDPREYFSILMTKSSTREDLMGPLSLSMLDQDRYMFLVDGYLPTAKIAWLDEAWKSNAAILNALLWLANERKFRNDGAVHDAPLHSMFIAANELPADDGLQAIYDRFVLRKIVSPINEPGSFITMLKAQPAPTTPVISWSDIETATVEVDEVHIPDDVYEAIVELKLKLREQEIFPSDRRFKQALKVVKAKTWLDGETEADINHLQVLRWVLWDEPSHFPTVEKLCLEQSNPMDLKIMEIMAALSGLSKEVDRAIADSGDMNRRLASGNELYAKVNEAREELTEIDKKMEGSKRKSVKMDQASSQLFTVANRILVKLFGTSEEEVKQGIEEFARPDGDF